MKKILMMCCALALPALVLFSSCKKDDDEGKTLAQSIEKTYPVNIWVSLTGTPDQTSDPLDASVAITAESSNSVSMSLIGFKFGQAEIPITLTGITVSGSEGNVTLAYNGAITSAELAQMGFTNLTGTLTGTIKGGVMSIQLAINATATTIHVAIASK